MNALKALQDYGQAVWLDFVSRGFLAKGGLKKLVDDDGLRGVTSNPSIFEHAIGNSSEYDDAIAGMLKQRDRSAGELFEALEVEDIQKATDVLRPVFEATHGADGFVSIEVSPYLAMDTEATIAEAKKLWRAVDRKNVMIKVPATAEGLPAIRDLIAEGINVNITLLFAQSVYEDVVEAYLKGLEMLAARGGDVSRIGSVASFFVSRIDTAVDTLLDDKIARANDPDEKRRLNALKGKVAVANAKLAYQHYLRLFDGARWRALKDKGAKPQRLLWASTGTKNKAYSDVLYVEELIGRDTVNTMPVATMDAFRDHGRLRDSITENIDEARDVLSGLARAGISLDDVTDRLVEDGVRLFADAADKLLAAVAKKRADILNKEVDQQKLDLGHALETKVGELAEEWRKRGNIRKLWRRDKTLWTNADEDKWLGWLEAVPDAELKEFAAFARRRQRRRLQGRGAARHGRIEPWTGSPGADLWTKSRVAAAAHPRFHRTGADRRARSRSRPRQDPVHRFVQVGQHDRAQCARRLFLQARRRRGRRRQGGPAFHRHHRSRLGAAEKSRAAKIPPCIFRRAQHRRALFRALTVRFGAGGDCRH